ncbi:hypothetical protein K457DRAFT_25461 [Linnemannia elongata AG-77]|uniref:Zincin n=1 Tax=Linnemannia elongata AG-77 TaxID=1314771 RepID=A0A197JD23_9FUNG|nr:hypothetical protein K457DRAFT_25461 [Linnemannia elongata AG-77]
MQPLKSQDIKKNWVDVARAVLDFELDLKNPTKDFNLRSVQVLHRPRLQYYFAWFLIRNLTKNRWRISGVAMDSPDFTKVFSCPVSSHMKLKKKCEVW